MVEKVKQGILEHVFAKILIMEKCGLKIKHLLLKIGFNKPRFCQNIDKFWL